MRKFLFTILLTSGICSLCSCTRYFFLDSDAVYRVDARENVREFIWRLKTATKALEGTDTKAEQISGSEKAVSKPDSVSD